MSLIDLLDSELRHFFTAVPSPVLNSDTLPAMRVAMSAAAPAIGLEGVLVETREITRPLGGSLRVLVVRPERPQEMALGFVHFHPGGWVLGRPEMSLAILSEIVANLGCTIVSADYGLAPEHPFPAAMDDAQTAWCWLIANAEGLGLDIACLGLLGESAGATIAMGLALKLRDEVANVQPFLLSLLYPALDDRTVVMSPHPFAGQIGLGLDSLRFAWESYLPNCPGDQANSPYAAPARATNLDGLCPVFVGTGSLDPLIDETLDFTKRLIFAGVKSELHVFDGGPHAFDRVSEAQISRNLMHERISWIRRTWALRS